MDRLGRAGRSVAWVLVLIAAGCRRDRPEPPPPPPPFAPSLSVDLGKMDEQDDYLYIQTLREGSGDEAKQGDKLWMRYTGWLPDGTQFDSNEQDRPLLVTLGKRFLIDGFLEGLQGIKTGEERLLVVPPALGYGKAGDPGVIPGDSWLVFRVRRVPGATTP